jgi:hypothetical protein
MKRTFWVLLLALVVVAPAALAADPAPSVNAQRIAEVLSSARRDVIEQAMGLTMEQKDAFWAIYNAYEAERLPLTQQALQMVENYVTNFTTMPKEEIVKMMSASSTNQKKIVDVRTKYAGQMAKKIGPDVGVRFYQIDDYLSTAARLDVLDDIPFVGRSQ